MPGTKTQFKIGLFALTGLAALIAVTLALGLSTRTERVRYQTYFDESVQGLSVGSPVKYRGVGIGAISDISIAPDRRQVSVGMGIDRDAVRNLGLATLAPELRAQLVIQGITGVKFIEIDRVDPAKFRPPTLAFPPARNYIPSRPSLFKGLEGQLGGVMRDVPTLIDSGVATLDKLGRLLDDIDRERLPARTANLIDELEGTTRDLRRWIADVQRARLPANAALTLAELRQLTGKLDATLAKLGDLDALIASAKRASDSFGELGRSTRSSTRDLDRTIGELGEAARAVRDFVDALEREPDMIVKGRRTK